MFLFLRLSMGKFLPPTERNLPKGALQKKPCSKRHGSTISRPEKISVNSTMQTTQMPTRRLCIIAAISVQFHRRTCTALCKPKS